MNAEQAAEDRHFSRWCVMDHARPIVIESLRAWGLRDEAEAIAETASTGALRQVTLDVLNRVRRVIRFGPVRRDLASAVNALNAAATFAGRGDAENTAAVAIGAFTGARGALAWRRPWKRFGWRAQRSAIMAAARDEQRARRESPASAG